MRLHNIPLETFFKDTKFDTTEYVFYKDTNGMIIQFDTTLNMIPLVRPVDTVDEIYDGWVTIENPLQYIQK